MNYDCLIIDDEKLLADMTMEYFNLFGVKSAVCYGIEECEKFLSENSAEVILLDINLGDGSGFKLCKTIREQTDSPILFISARQADDDKIIALSIGGDDYVEKPYSLGVLLAKVKAVLKRYAKNSGEYSDGYLSVSEETKRVTIKGKEVKLTFLEFKLLSYLIKNGGRVVKKQEIFEKVWEDKFTGDGTLNVHIRKLREAIEPSPNNPEYLITVWGDGYKFVKKN